MRTGSWSTPTTRATGLLRDGVVGSSLALVVLVGTLAQISDQRWTLEPPGGWVECLIFVSAVAAGTARHFPLPALALAALLDALPYWLPIGGAGYHLSLMICVFFVVSRVRPTVARIAVLVVLVVQVGLMAYEKDWLWTHIYVGTAALSVLFPAAMGATARARRQSVQALRQRAEAAEQSRDAEARKLLAEDRLRTARDLHDSVAHQIAVVTLSANVASSALPDRPADAEVALERIRDAGRSAIASISELLSGLRRDDLATSSPRHDTDELMLLVERFRTLLPDLRLRTTGWGEGNQAVDPVLFSVVLEGLTNAYKHGDHDEPVHLNVSMDPGTATVHVTNRPRGDVAERDEGFGLQGMRERVEAAGGCFDAFVDRGRFIVTARIPQGVTP